MKKIISVFLAAVLFVSSFSIVANAAEISLNANVDTVNAQIGDTVTLGVIVTNTVEASAFMLVDFTYEETQLELQSGKWTLTHSAMKKDLNISDEIKDASIAYETNQTITGKIFELTFKVISTSCVNSPVTCVMRARHSAGERLEDDVIDCAMTPGAVNIVHAPVVDAAVPATCTVSGKKEGSHCSKCGQILVAQDVVNPIPHTPVTDAGVPATCTTPGKTQGSHCSVCGTVLSAQATVNPIPHTPVTDAAVPATCTTPGKTQGSHCSVCSTVLSAQSTINAFGHSFVTGRCTVCGAADPSYVPPTPAPVVTTVAKPKAPSLSKVTAAKASFTATWKKVSGVKGYEIQYSTDKKFKKNNKTTTIKKANTVKTTVKKLKAKKTYYVRIRAYKTDANGKKVYSSWSKAKTVKVK